MYCYTQSRRFITTQYNCCWYLLLALQKNFVRSTAQLGPRHHFFRCLCHTQSDTHVRQESSVRVNSSSQRPLPTQHTTETQQTNIQVLGGIQTLDPSNQAVFDRRLRKHWSACTFGLLRLAARWDTPLDWKSQAAGYKRTQTLSPRKYSRSIENGQA
jgi:hypothetical protein